MTEGVAAGPFGEWLEAMRAVLRGERDADVPCGTCVGCCVSSYPIPLRPTDRVAQDQVPEQYVMDSPGLAPGHLLMGFRADGTCPMYAVGCCSIYRDRPQTCRDYDCRIYAATGTLPAGERPLINARVSAWQFQYSGEADRALSLALQRAAAFIRQNHARFPTNVRASSPTAAAVLAIKTYPLFLSPLPTSPAPADIALRVTATLEMAQAFDRNQRFK